MEFDLKIIKRVTIFQDFHELFTINRVGVSRSGRHPLLKLRSSTSPRDENKVNAIYTGPTTVLKHSCILQHKSRQSVGLGFTHNINTNMDGYDVAIDYLVTEQSEAN